MLNTPYNTITKHSIEIPPPPNPLILVYWCFLRYIYATWTCFLHLQIKLGISVALLAPFLRNFFGNFGVFLSKNFSFTYFLDNHQFGISLSGQKSNDKIKIMKSCYLADYWRHRRQKGLYNTLKYIKTA